MEKKSKKIGWDIYEAAMLLDGFLESLSYNGAKAELIRKISSKLRAMAVNRGVLIDDVFRNCNGIRLQLCSMESAYYDKEDIFTASNLFKEIVAIYKNDPERYFEILREAKAMSDNKVPLEEFSLNSSSNPVKDETPLEERLRIALKNISEHNSFGTTIELLMEKTHTKSTAVVKSILDTAKWAKLQYHRYYYVDEIKKQVEPEQEEIEQSKQIELSDKEDKKQNTLYFVDFHSKPDLSYTRPVSLSYFEEENTGFSSWKDIYVHFVSIMCEDYPRKFKVGMSFTERHGRADLLNDDEIYRLCDPRSVPGTKFELETNISANGILNRIKRIMDLCNVNYENVVISYCKDENRAKRGCVSEMQGQSVPQKMHYAPTPELKLEPSFNDFNKSRFEETLLRRYRNGMNFDSIDFDIFRDTYSALYNEKLAFDDTALEKRLRLCGVIYMGRLFPAVGIMDSKTKEKLFSYIDSSFAYGKKVIYYKAIYEDLADTFASCYTLNDEKMLKAYIEYSAQSGKYFFFPDYMAKEKAVSINHSAEVEEFFLNAGKPMPIDGAYATLSHIPQEQVKRIITTDARFIRNAKSEYFHKDIFEVSDDELSQVAGIINSYIEDNGFAIWNDVWNEMRKCMPLFFENNLYLSPLGVRNTIELHFMGKYYFKGAVISLPTDNLSLRDIYKLYAKHHSEYTAEDINNLSKELGMERIYFDALADISVRVNQSLFVSRERIHFDVDAIDRAIESYMANDYIRIREIDSFLAFPNVGYEWNEYLLESFVAYYSKKFILINNGYALNNVAGAIVKKYGKIKEFVDICAAELSKSGLPLNNDEALDYLVKTNLITRRSYKDLNEAVRKASRIRGRGE